MHTRPAPEKSRALHLKERRAARANTAHSFLPNKVRMKLKRNPSRLGPRELEHYDPSIFSVFRDVELVALHEDGSDSTF